MKKTLIIFICLLIIILSGLFFFFKSKLPVVNDTLTKNQSIENILSDSFGVKDCSLYQDTASVAKSKEINNCDCLATTSRDQCKNYMMDEMYYNQAFQQADPSICAMMSYESGRAACIKVVNERISSLTKDSSDDLLLAYISTNNYDEAIKILENKIIGEQKTVKYLNFLAQEYAEKALSEHKEAEYIPKALILIEKAKQIEPKNPEVYITEGFIYEIKPDLNKAIESYNKVLILDANSFSAYTGRGHTKEMLGDTAGAFADFNKAATLDTKQENINIYSNLCRINYYFNNIEDSIKNCSIIINSKFASSFAKSEAYQILGLVYSALEKYDEAWTQFKIAETYDPTNINLMLSISNLFLSKGDPIQAEEYSRKAITLDSERAIPYEKLAASLMSQNKNEEAITNALKALGLVSKDVSILLNYKKDVNFRIYSILVQVYKQIGDKTNQSKYEVLRDSLSK